MSRRSYLRALKRSRSHKRLRKHDLRVLHVGAMAHGGYLVPFAIVPSLSLLLRSAAVTATAEPETDPSTRAAE
jgi:hypothetical protein